MAKFDNTSNLDKISDEYKINDDREIIKSQTSLKIFLSSSETKSMDILILVSNSFNSSVKKRSALTRVCFLIKYSGTFSICDFVTSK